MDSAEGIDESEDLWVISVSDDGVGIPEEDQDRIFEVVQRLRPHEERSGTGIGLALCKRIVDRHDGEIWVDSGLGRGRRSAWRYLRRRPKRHLRPGRPARQFRYVS